MSEPIEAELTIKMICDFAKSGSTADVMEKLLDRYEIMQANVAERAFYAALRCFQTECPTISKKEGVRDKAGDMRYKFAPLPQIQAEIQPHLDKNGFSYDFDTPGVPENGYVKVSVHLFHDAGHHIIRSFPVKIDEKAYMNAPQKIGSAHSFGKRYALVGVLAIRTDDLDDDANLAEKGSVADQPGRQTEARPIRPQPPQATPAEKARLAQAKAGKQRADTVPAKDAKFLISDKQAKRFHAKTWTASKRTGDKQDAIEDAILAQFGLETSGALTWNEGPGGMASNYDAACQYADTYPDAPVVGPRPKADDPPEGQFPDDVKVPF